jgi:hypothetical protein
MRLFLRSATVADLKQTMKNSHIKSEGISSFGLIHKRGCYLLMKIDYTAF